MIITPEEKRQIIPITPETPVEASIPAPMSLIRQGTLVLKNSSLEDDIRQLELDNIQNKTAQQVRHTARIVSQQKAIDNFRSVLGSESDQNVVNAAMVELTKQYAGNAAELEHLTVESLMEEAVQDSPVSAYIQSQDQSFFQALGTRLKKDLILDNKLQALQEDIDKGDIALNLGGEVSLLNGLQRSFGFGFTDYGDQLRELSTAIEEASPEELPSLLDEQEQLIRSVQFLGDNPAFVAEVMGLAAQGSQHDLMDETLFNIIDAADTFLIAGSLLKGTKGITGTDALVRGAIDSGNTQKLAEDLQEAGGRFSDPEDPRNFGAMIGLKTEFDEADNLSPKVRQEYETSQRILRQAIPGNKAISYKDVMDIQEGRGIKEQLKRQFHNGSVGSITKKEDGTSDVVLFDSNGDTYLSEADALKAKGSRGFGSAEVVQVADGGWGLKVNFNSEDVHQANLSSKGVSWWRRWFGRPESWVDRELLSYGQLSEASINQLIKEGQKVYDRSIAQLSLAERDALMPLLERQRNERRWYTPDELDEAFRQLPPNRGLNEKEMQAFAGYRLLNEFQYNLDNGVLFDRLNAQGFGTVSQEHLGLAVEARMVDSFPESRYIYLRDEGQTVAKDDVSEDFLNNYDVVEVHNINDLKELPEYVNLAQNPTRYIAVPKDTIQIGQLTPSPLPYIAGGRARYDNSTVFLKQKKQGTRPDGSTYRTADSTKFSATSMPHAEKEASLMNKLNRILREGLENPNVRERAEAFLKQRAVLGTNNLDAYLKRIQDKDIDYNEKIVAVRNREMIPDDSKGATEILEGTDISMQFAGRLGKRSETRVEPIDPDQESLLNPLDSLNQNFVAAANNHSFSAYREYAMAHLERFRPYLEVDPNTPASKLLDAGIKQEFRGDSAKIRRIEGEQKFAREVVGRQSAKEVAATRTVERIVEQALDRIPPFILSGKYKNRLIAKASDAATQDPFGKMRGIVFNAKLGLFSIPAMAIQMAHAPIIATMAPRHGLKALLTVPVLRIGLLSDDPQTIKLLADKAEVLGLKGYGDLQKFFQEFRNHGFDSFSANSAYENAARGDNVYTRAGVRGAFNTVAEKGRIFFEEGEMVPRMTAYGVAVREWLSDPKLNPNKLPIDSKEGSRYISQRTNTLTLGMTRADIQQGLQSGPTALAGQFQSYPLRALDALVFPSQGLSKSERSLMAAGYLMMYGAAGIPAMGYIADQVSDSFDLSPEMHKTLYNGIVDGFILAILGEDTNFASRGGLGSWITELIDSMQEGTFIDVVTGPSGSTTGGAFDTLIEYQKLWSAGYNPDPARITSSVVMDFAQEISSFNNIYRTWVAYQQGKIYDSRGNQFMDVTAKGAFLQLAGFPPQAYENMGSLYTSQDTRRLIIRNHTETMVQLQRRFAQALKDNNREELRKISDIYNNAAALAQMDGLTQEVNSAVARELTGDSTYQRLRNEAMLQQNLGEKGVIPKEMQGLMEELNND